MLGSSSGSMAFERRHDRSNAFSPLTGLWA